MRWSLPTTIRHFRPEQIPLPNARLFALLAREPTGLPHFDIEIGSGAGLFAIRYCQQHPERHLWAIEKTAGKAGRLLRRKETHPELTNLLALHADARSVLTHCVPPSSVDRIFLWYPNPNPKNPAQRWFRMPFTEQLISRLKPGGELFMATNIDWYAEEARALLTSVWKLREVRFQSFNKSSEPRTHFERKYLERGETCWEMTFQKNTPQ